MYIYMYIYTIIYLSRQVNQSWLDVSNYYCTHCHGEVRLTPAYSPAVLFGLTTFQYFNISKPTIYHISTKWGPLDS